MKFARTFVFICLSPLVVAVPARLHAQESPSIPLLVARVNLPNAPLPQPGPQTEDFSSSWQQSAPVQQAGDQQSEQGQKKESDKDLKQEEKQRMLGIVPSFNAVISGESAPLSSKQKFSLWFRSAIDPFTFATAGIDAWIEQSQNEYPEYGKGFTGYAKRYGASYADNIDGNFWGNAVLPSLLHQDPRYFRLGHGKFSKRAVYALISTVRCKGDNGKWQPSYSNIGGNLIGGAISNLYYPASDRGISLTLERGLTVTATGAIGAFAFEFYPDAIAYLKRHHHQKA